VKFFSNNNVDDEKVVFNILFKTGTATPITKIFTLLAVHEVL